MPHSEIFFPFSSSNLIHIEPLKLVDSFNEWFDRSNKIISALNPLNMYDVSSDGGLQHSDTFSEIEINRGPGVRVNVDNQLTLDIYNLPAREIVDSEEAGVEDDIYVAATDYFVLEKTAGGDPSLLRKILSGYMLPSVVYGDHTFAGDITMLADFTSATTKNFRIEDQQIELAYPQNEQGVSLPVPYYAVNDVTLGGNSNTRAGVVVIGRKSDADRQQMEFNLAYASDVNYISGHDVIQGANQVHNQGVTVSTTNQLSGTCGLFDGNVTNTITGSYMHLAHAPEGSDNFFLTGDFQIDAFVRPEEDRSFSIIEQWGTGGDNAWRLRNDHSNNKVEFHWSTEAGVTGGAITGSVDIAGSAAWHHVAVVAVENVGFGLYVDGARAATGGALGSSRLHNSDEMPIIGGAAISGGVNYPHVDTSKIFKGRMDDIRLVKGKNTFGITTTFPATISPPTGTSTGGDASLFIDFSRETDGSRKVRDSRGVYGTVVDFVTGTDIDDEATFTFATAPSGGNFTVGEQFQVLSGGTSSDKQIGLGTVQSFFSAGSPFTTVVEISTGVALTGAEVVVKGISSGVTGFPANVVPIDLDPFLAIDGVTGFNGITGFITGNGEILSAGYASGGGNAVNPRTELGTATYGGTSGEFKTLEDSYESNNKEWTFNFGSDGADTTTLGGAWRTTEHIEFVGEEEKGMYSSTGYIPVQGPSAKTYMGMSLTNVGQPNNWRVEFHTQAHTTGKSALHFTHITGTTETTGWIMNPDGTQYSPTFALSGSDFAGHTYAGTGDEFRSSTHPDSFSRYANPYNVPVADKYGNLNYSWTNRRTYTNKTELGTITGHDFITGMAIRRQRTTGDLGGDDRQWVAAFASQVTGPGDVDNLTGNLYANRKEPAINAEALGIVSRVIDNNTFEICFSGPISFTTGEIKNFLDSSAGGRDVLSPGEPYFISTERNAVGKLTFNDPDDLAEVPEGVIKKTMFVATAPTEAVVVNYIGGIVAGPATGTVGDDDSGGGSTNNYLIDDRHVEFVDDQANYGSAGGLPVNPDPGADRRFFEVSAQGHKYLRKLEIVTTDIKDENISRAKIANTAIDSTKIANNAVTTNKISEGAITRTRIAGFAIGTDQIENASVTQEKLASDITIPIDQGAITTVEILDGTIRGSDITTSSGFRITSSNLEDDSIVSRNIADSAVTTDRVADGAITNRKIENGAVGSVKIEDGAVTTTKIASNTIIWDDINKSGFQASQDGTLKSVAGQLKIVLDSEADATFEGDNIFVLAEHQQPATSGGRKIDGTIPKFELGEWIPRRLNWISEHFEDIQIGPLTGQSTTLINAQTDPAGFDSGEEFSTFINTIPEDVFQLHRGAAEQYHFHFEVPAFVSGGLYKTALFAQFADDDYGLPHGKAASSTNSSGVGKTWNNVSSNGKLSFPNEKFPFAPTGNYTLHGVSGWYPILLGSTVESPNGGGTVTSVIDGKVTMPNTFARFTVASIRTTGGYNNALLTGATTGSWGNSFQTTDATGSPESTATEAPYEQYTIGFVTPSKRPQKRFGGHTGGAQNFIDVNGICCCVPDPGVSGNCGIAMTEKQCTDLYKARQSSETPRFIPLTKLVFVQNRDDIGEGDFVVTTYNGCDNCRVFAAGGPSGNTLPANAGNWTDANGECQF